MWPACLGRRDGSSENELLYLSILVTMTFLSDCIPIRVSDAKRYLTNGVCPKLKEIKDSIACLEKVEKQLAKEYGMSGRIDSANVLEKTKQGAREVQQDRSTLTRIDHLPAGASPKSGCFSSKGEVLGDVDRMNEERIAEKYGMSGDIDSVKIIQEVERREEAFKESLQQLDQLHERRIELNGTRCSSGEASSRVGEYTLRVAWISYIIISLDL
ncbi:hypothetical protein EDD18DRAFT_1162624 [Armillaria luteobubalina]|uniref:Uncharacterized protein n=1 Tax=Armillaria luteobubalina TaxID=153913 RepID=A0AA39Q7A9_9AGAR|nr:hypothetical protein EDD18DRAFT_1162624 [Armillaria luteobubalina]